MAFPSKIANGDKPPPLKISFKLSSSADSIASQEAPSSAPPSLKHHSLAKLKISLKKTADSFKLVPPSSAPSTTLSIPKIKIKPAALKLSADKIPQEKEPDRTSPQPMEVDHDAGIQRPHKRAKIVHFYDLIGKLIDLFKSKDVYGFFWEPVDTAQVPDYLDVIQEPMDFSSMESKVATQEYRSISEFERDFLLIISNAKTYNPSESAYYKTANKLYNYGSKLISKEAQRIAEGDYELIYDGSLKSGSKQSVGRFSSSGHDSSLAASSHSLRNRETSRISYAEDENFDEFSILNEEDTEAIQKDSLTKRSNIALFKRAADGSMQFSSLAHFQPEFYTDGSLALTPGQIKQLLITEYATDRYPIPTLGQVINDHTLNPKFFNPSTVQYDWLCSPLNYGPYINSFAPTHDSSKSSISSAEAMLLSLTYADSHCKDFIQSLQQFANETEFSYLIRYVKGLVNVLTKGTPAVHNIPIAEHLQNASLAASALEHALVVEGKDVYPPIEDPSESALYQISKQLLQLVRIQNERLASSEPAVISPEEQQRSLEIKNRLTEMCSFVQPHEIISEQAVFDLYQNLQQPAVPFFQGNL